jgi:hypothetical protein
MRDNMGFFNPNSFDAHDDRLYDQEPSLEETAGNEPAPEELPEALIEAAIPPVAPVQPTGTATLQPKQNPFQAQTDAFIKKYQNSNDLTIQPSEQQEAAELRDKLINADNLLKAIMLDPALNKPSDSFTPQHIVAIKKYLQGAVYYCELLKDDLIKSKALPPSI